jgi:hypothetical protein
MAVSDDLGDFTAEDLACAGFRRVGDGEDLIMFTTAERHASLIAAITHIEALKCRQRRREEARQIRIIKAAQKAGLPVKRAVIDGVTVEFGTDTPLAPPNPEIETPEQLRRLI